MSWVEDYRNPWQRAYRVEPGRRAGKNRRLVVLLGWPLLLLGGCLSRVHEPYLGPRSERPAQPRLAAFEAPLETIEPHVTPAHHRARHHRALALSAPSVTDNGQKDGRIRATFFESTAPSPRPLVVVLPIWGVSAYPPRQIVRRLLSGPIDRQVNVLWIHGEQRLFDWESVEQVDTEADVAAILTRWTAAAAGTVIDIRRLIAWTRERPSAARRPVVVVGFSISAIVSALVAGTDDNVVGGVMVFGGAHVDQIIRHCGGKTHRFREAVYARTSMSESRLSALLRDTLDPINPVHYTGTINPRDVLVIDASRDDCIPDQAREDFWLALGRPERLSVAYSHRRAFLTLTPLGFHRVTRDVVSFLTRVAFEPHLGPIDSPRPHRDQVSSSRPDRRP